MDSGDNRTCPFCAEIIKRGAIVCRYCGRDVPVSDAPAPSTNAAAPKDHEPPLTLQPSPKAPTTYKSYWYITVPITLLLLLAWHNRFSVAGYMHGDAGFSTARPTEAIQTPSTVTITSTGETVTTEMTNSTLDLEAKAEAIKVFEGIVTNCDDKYYMWNDQGGSHSWFIEFREKPVLYIGSSPISDEDRMNGLTWQGTINFSSSADMIVGSKDGTIAPRGAMSYSGNHWSLGQSHSFHLWKNNGSWVYVSYMGDQTPSDSFTDKVPCEKKPGNYSQKDASKTDSPQELSPTQQAIIKEFTMLDNAAQTWDHASISSRFSWLVDNGYSPSYRDFQWSTLPSNITDSFVKWYNANHNV